MNWPPITMATQHPDNAASAWWKADPFVSTQEEIDELMILFRELPIDEYMWDWEGKYVDESVAEKLFSRGQDLFRSRPLGSELHLTYRIPAFDGGKMHRMARAMMNILAAADLAHDLHVPHLPITEMFLPLTTSAEQPLHVRRAFREVAHFHRKIFHDDVGNDQGILEAFAVTPLVEDVASLFHIETIVRPYWEHLQKQKEVPARGLRIFLARSDPALNAGLVPAVLAVKAALSITAEVGEELKVPVHPIIGTGSLPFRGSVNPTYLDTFLDQYAGVRTYSIQSAFRYDYPKEDVIAALTRMRSEAPTKEVVRFTVDERQDIRELAGLFEQFWKPTIEKLAPLINRIAAFVPPRRERLQHIGLFGYSRGVGGVQLPRAIGFTAALYSLGIPPELIATGRGLAAAKEKKKIGLLERAYPALRMDLKHAGKYLNRENIVFLAKQDPIFETINEDIRTIESLLDIHLEPEKPHHIIHRNITSTILHRLYGNVDPEVIRENITEAAKIRRSIG